MSKIIDLKSKESILCYSLYKYAYTSLPNYEGILNSSELTDDDLKKKFRSTLLLMDGWISSMFDRYDIENRLSDELKRKQSRHYNLKFPLLRIYTSNSRFVPEATLFYGYMKPKCPDDLQTDMFYSFPYYFLLECELKLLSMLDQDSVYTGTKLYRAEIWDYDKYRFFKNRIQKSILERKYFETSLFFSTSADENVASSFQMKLLDQQRQCVLKFEFVELNNDLVTCYKNTFPEIHVIKNLDISKYSAFQHEKEILVNNWSHMRIFDAQEKDSKLEVSIIAVNGSVRTFGCAPTQVKGDPSNEKLLFSKYFVPSIFSIELNIFEEIQKQSLLSLLDDNHSKHVAAEIDNFLSNYFSLVAEHKNGQKGLDITRKLMWDKVSFYDVLVKKLDISDSELLLQIRKKTQLLLLGSTKEFQDQFSTITLSLLDSLINFSKQCHTKSDLKISLSEQCKALFKRNSPKSDSTEDIDDIIQNPVHLLTSIETFLREYITKQSIFVADSSIIGVTNSINMIRFLFDSGNDGLEFNRQIDQIIESALRMDSIDNYTKMSNYIGGDVMTNLFLNRDDQAVAHFEKRKASLELFNKVKDRDTSKLSSNSKAYTSSQNFLLKDIDSERYFYQELANKFKSLEIESNLDDFLHAIKLMCAPCYLPVESYCKNPLFTLSIGEYLQYLSGNTQIYLAWRSSKIFDETFYLLINALFAAVIFNCSDRKDVWNKCWFVESTLSLW